MQSTKIKKNKEQQLAFILIVISIAVFAITLSCHAVDATDAKVILFNDEMDINAWSYWWGNYTSYDAGEGAYKVSFRTDGSPATCMEMDTGISRITVFLRISV